MSEATFACQTYEKQEYPVLVPLSVYYPRHKDRLSTRYSPVRHSTQDRSPFRVRLACVKHAASVRSEPGSNSPVLYPSQSQLWLDLSNSKPITTWPALFTVQFSKIKSTMSVCCSPAGFAMISCFEYHVNCFYFFLQLVSCFGGPAKQRGGMVLECVLDVNLYLSFCFSFFFSFSFYSFIFLFQSWGRMMYFCPQTSKYILLITKIVPLKRIIDTYHWKYLTLIFFSMLNFQH